MDMFILPQRETRSTCTGRHTPYSCMASGRCEGSSMQHGSFDSCLSDLFC